MNLHVFIGEDEFLLDEATKKLVGEGDCLEIVDSGNSGNEDSRLADLRRVEESILTPPFLEPRKVTWWKRVGFLPGSGKKGEEEKVSEAVKDALKKFADRIAASPLPANQHFVLTASSLNKTTIFAKTLATVAEVIYFGDKSSRNGLPVGDRVREEAEDRGLTFASGAMERFIQFVGTDTRSLLNELDKLQNYLGGEKRPVKEADINDITSVGVGVEPALWDVTDALGKRDAKGALEAIRRFELERGFEVFMAVIIEKFFRQLYDLKLAETQNRKLPTGMNPYFARQNAKFLRNWTQAELRAARWRFLNLRERFVSGSNSNIGPTLVVIEILRVIRRRQGAAKWAAKR